MSLLECPCCYEEVDRLLMQPIVCIPRRDIPSFEDGDDHIDWHAPGQGFPGKDRYDVLRSDERTIYARPWECTDLAICYRCWAGHTIPAIESYLFNKPPQLKLNGWRQPEWIEETP